MVLLFCCGIGVRPIYHGMPLRPQSAKSKGRRHQQAIAQSIRAAFPHLGADDVVSTSMGAPGEDVRMSPLARASLPLSLECKNVEKLNVWKCIDQAQSNCPPGATACVVFTKNHAPSYAVVPWATLLALYEHRQQASLPPRLSALLTELAHFAPPVAPVAPAGTVVESIALDDD